MLIGYARVSTLDQGPALQLNALAQPGCGKVFDDHASRSARRFVPAYMEHLIMCAKMMCWFFAVSVSLGPARFALPGFRR